MFRLVIFLCALTLISSNVCAEPGYDPRLDPFGVTKGNRPDTRIDFGSWLDHPVDTRGKPSASEGIAPMFPSDVGSENRRRPAPGFGIGVKMQWGQGPNTDEQEQAQRRLDSAREEARKRKEEKEAATAREAERRAKSEQVREQDRATNVARVKADRERAEWYEEAERRNSTGTMVGHTVNDQGLGGREFQPLSPRVAPYARPTARSGLAR